MSENDKLKKSKFFFVNLLNKFHLSNKVKIGVAMALFFVIIALFLGGISSNKMSEEEETMVAENSQTYYNDYVLGVEGRLKKVISSVKGVGNVEVFVYVESSPQIILAEDKEEKVSENPDGSQTKTSISTTVLTKDGSSITEHICVMEIYPEIVGVLVVAGGADDEKVRLAILNAVVVLLDIENTRVEVLQGK